MSRPDFECSVSRECRGHLFAAVFFCKGGNNASLNFQFEATKFEESWSRQALEMFYEDGWIQDVLYRVKVGKEATVYCCKADSAFSTWLMQIAMNICTKFSGLNNPGGFVRIRWRLVMLHCGRSGNSRVNRILRALRS